MAGTTCKSCGKRIFWARTEKNTMMPVDAEPADDGNVMLHEGIAFIVRSGDLFADGELKYKSHFATCPNAKQHRRK